LVYNLTEIDTSPSSGCLSRSFRYSGNRLSLLPGYAGIPTGGVAGCSSRRSFSSDHCRRGHKRHCVARTHWASGLAHV